MKNGKTIEAVYIYIYIENLSKIIYVNIVKKLCFLEKSKRHSFYSTTGMSFN